LKPYPNHTSRVTLGQTASDAAFSAQLRGADDRVVQPILARAPAHHGGNNREGLEQHERLLDEAGTEEAPVVLAVEDVRSIDRRVGAIDARHLPDRGIVHDEFDRHARAADHVADLLAAGILDDEPARDRRRVARDERPQPASRSNLPQLVSTNVMSRGGVMTGSAGLR
jgi:hypothetical protein